MTATPLFPDRLQKGLYFAPALVLLLSLIALVLLWRELDVRHAYNLRDHFQAESARIGTKISLRMSSYTQILRGGAGLFAASENVDRIEWKRYIDKLELDQTFRGIQGVGFAQYIRPEQFEAHLRSIRRQGFPDYVVKPSGQRADYSSIIYLEPFSGRNLRAFGYDMFSEPVRHAAMAAARDSGLAVFSGKVQLVQETSTDVQAGILAYHPVYARGALPQTVEQRRAALLGWTYSPYRMNDMMEGIVSDDLDNIRLEIFDGDSVHAEALLFDSEKKVATNATPSGLLLVSRLELEGRTWTLRYSALPGFSAATKFEPPWVEFTAILIIGLLLFAITWALVNTRRRAEQMAGELTTSLRQSEARFRANFEQAAVGVAHVDVATGRFLRINHCFCAFLGYSRGELEQMSFHDVTYAEDLHLGTDQMREIGERAINSFSLEKRYRRKEGRIVWGHVTISAVFDAVGQAEYFIAVVEDITRRKDLELALTDSERHWQALIEATPVGVFETDAQGKCVFVNPRWLELTGLSLESAKGDGWAGALHPEDQAKIYAEWEASVAEGRPFKLEYRFLRPDGSVVWVLGQSCRLSASTGDLLGYLGTVTDISERKQAEAKLLDSENHLRTIIENEPECIKIIDEQGRLVDINPAGLVMIEADRLEQVAGQPVLEVIAPEYRSSFADLHQRVISGQPAQMEYQAQGLKGGRRWLETHAVPMQDKGAIVHLAVTRDISARKQAEVELDRYRNHLEALVQERTVALSVAKEAAEASNRAKSTFLANMSHELRTPMNAIMGMTTLALRRASDPKQIDQLSKVSEGAQRLLGIINNILDISKLEAERISLERIHFQLREVLENMNRLLGPKAAEKGVQLGIEILPELASQPLLGDSLRLGQILVNLIDNALKFTTEGSVTVRVWPLETEANNLLLHFEVQDSGIGIAADDQKRLFTAFEQGDGSTTRKYGGTGLGLAISKRLAQMMGGSIGVDSQPGVGSTFWFTARLSKGEPIRATDEVST